MCWASICMCASTCLTYRHGAGKPTWWASVLLSSKVWAEKDGKLLFLIYLKKFRNWCSQPVPDCRWANLKRFHFNNHFKLYKCCNSNICFCFVFLSESKNLSHLKHYQFKHSTSQAHRASVRDSWIYLPLWITSFFSSCGKSGHLLIQCNTFLSPELHWIIGPLLNQHS